MRYFIYVNHNIGTEHITIHCEKEKHCSEILKRADEQLDKISADLKKINANTKAFKILTVTKETGKKSKNGYWVLLWADENFCNNYLDNDIIKAIAEEHGISKEKINLCKKCS